MKTPRVLKVDKLAAPADRAQLHELACAFAEEQFAEQGSAPFLWLLAIAADVVWIETPWRDDREKYAFTEFMRQLMERYQAHAYAFMTEAWVSSTDAARSDEDREMLRLRAEEGLGLDVLPDHLRDDVLLVMSFDRDHGYAMSRWLVTVRSTGLNLLGPRQEPGLDADRFEGRMWNLLTRKERPQ